MTDIKQILKKVVPESIQRTVRYSSIHKEQDRVALLLDGYIEDYFKGDIPQYDIVPKKDLGGKKIIWQYWAQGTDGELPYVVKLCFDSVDKWKGDYMVIRLSDEDISDYIDFPVFILEKKAQFGRTIFSDVLRLALLYAYGGIWLDATVLLTGRIPDFYKEQDFFMFRRSDEENNKEYWEGTYSAYFGWQKWFKVRSLSSIIFTKVENASAKDLCNLLLNVWKRSDRYPCYFTFQVMYDRLSKYIQTCPIVNDCLPHALMQFINDSSYKKIESLEEILQHSTMHKLSYKNIDMGRLNFVVGRLRADGLI